MDYNIQLGLDADQQRYSSSEKHSREQLPGVEDRVEGGVEQPSAFEKCCPALSAQYYRNYFDVTQAQVKERVLKALTPWKSDFFQGIGEKPDLYGPLWILTTIIFLLSLAGNLSRYLSNIGQQGFTFKMELFRYSVLIGYSFGFGFPVLLGLLLRFFNSRVGIFDLICLYGYSLTCFVIILSLCTIPLNLLQWILMSYGIVNSCLFLVLNLRDQLNNLLAPQRYVVYGVIASVQICLFLIFKLVFFNMIFEEPVDS